jgi:RNA polymerase sigma-70 factor, ECF subfamily
MPAAAPHLHAELALLLAQQRRKVVAQLVRALGMGHLAVAEDAVQTAALRALTIWPAQGPPANPAGWLYRVARHAAIDALRLAGRHEPWPDDGEAVLQRLSAQAPPTGRFASELDDDELALLFAACHPKLAAASQVALALRALAGLDLASIAKGLLCSEAALAQRLARARQALAGLTLCLPAGAELPARHEQVLTALSLMFHAGMTARAEHAAGGQGQDLCWEAIRLARALTTQSALAQPELRARSDALASMLLLHGARLTGRLDAAGDIVLLAGQARDRWDAGMVRMGMAHLQAAQQAQHLSRWHVMAGLAAEHALAANYASTNWRAIVAYYEMLLALDGSAAPRLGHAIALAEAGEAAQAKALLSDLLTSVPPALRAHTLAALARAHERLGEIGLAQERLQQAMKVAPSDADARLLMRRAQALSAP